MAANGVGGRRIDPRARLPEPSARHRDITAVAQMPCLRYLYLTVFCTAASGRGVMTATQVQVQGLLLVAQSPVLAPLRLARHLTRNLLGVGAPALRQALQSPAAGRRAGFLALPGGSLSSLSVYSPGQPDQIPRVHELSPFLAAYTTPTTPTLPCREGAPLPSSS